jgi:hypothetical protein
MSEPLIDYTPRPDATSTGELGALAAVYKFCMSSQAKKKAGGSNAGENDARKVKDVCTAEENYTRT